MLPCMAGRMKIMHRRIEKKQELGPHRPLSVSDSANCSEGYRLLEEPVSERFVPVLVPPWNRIDPLLLPGIAGARL